MVPGALVIEPVRNGWIVILFEEEPEDEPPPPTPQTLMEESEDSDGWSFEKERERPQQGPVHHTAILVGGRPPDLTEPQRFIFRFDEHDKMVEFVAAHAKKSVPAD